MVGILLGRLSCGTPPSWLLTTQHAPPLPNPTSLYCLVAAVPPHAEPPANGVTAQPICWLVWTPGSAAPLASSLPKDAAELLLLLCRTEVQRLQVGRVARRNNAPPAI